MSAGRGISCAVIVVGLFISSEPQIWGLKTQQTASDANSSLTERILWPLCFALGFIPFALVNLTCEKELTRKNVMKILIIELIVLLLYMHVFDEDSISTLGVIAYHIEKLNIKKDYIMIPLLWLNSIL